MFFDQITFSFQNQAPWLCLRLETIQIPLSINRFEGGRSFDIVLGRFISDLFGISISDDLLGIFISDGDDVALLFSAVQSFPPDARIHAARHGYTWHHHHHRINATMFLCSTFLTFIIISTLIMIFIWRRKNLGKTSHLSLWNIFSLSHFKT